jgi:hypothetical protein
MTKRNILSWSMWIVSILAVLSLAACNGNGPVTPNPSDVKDYSSKGGLDNKTLFSFMGNYEALKTAGGGAETVDTNGYTLIATFDRWTKTNMDTYCQVTEANDETTTVLVHGVTLFKDLEYPITVTVWADWYTRQTILGTDSTIMAFGMERSNTDGTYGMLAGISQPDVLEGIPHFGWLSVSRATQSLAGYTKTFGDDDYPYTYLQSIPWRPTGVATFIYALTDMPSPTISGPSSSLIPHLQDIPLDDWTPVGYSYDDLNFMMGSMFSSGTWVMNVQPIDEVKTLSTGDFSFPVPSTKKGGTLVSASLEFTAGTGLSDSWEFVPNSLPCDINSVETTGSYTLKGIDPIVTGDRYAVRANINYSSGGSETRYVDIAVPGGENDINFGIAPVLSSISIEGGSRINASWENEAESGLLVLEISTGNALVQRIVLDSTAEGITPNIPIYMTSASPLGRLYARIIRIGCADTDVDDFNYSDIWTNQSSISFSSIVAL